MKKTTRVISVLLGVVLSTALVVAAVYASTTIGTNIVTTGTLTAGAASTTGDFWLGTVDGGDDDSLYFDASSSESIVWDDVPGEFDISDDLNITGGASTTAYVYIATYLKLLPIATPTALTSGQCFIDDTDNQLNCYTGAAWQQAW